VSAEAVSMWDQAGAGFAGKVTLITGAGRGIGKQAALALVQLGGKVAIADLVKERAESVAAEIEAAGGQAIAVQADVTRAEDVRAMVKTVMDHFGAIHHVVNCAGAYRAKSPTLEIPDGEWDLIVDSNLKGTFLTSQAALPHMIAAGGGAIVNMSSVAGRTCSPFLGAHYSAAKAGVLGLTRHLANEFGSRGVRVNAIAPGTVVGDRVVEITAPEAAAAMASQTPLGRLAEARDIVGVILFLLSDLSRFMTGATVDVNGGFILM
jgi:3-oxoacyl-[acyl-carrier protein] reductase